MMNRNKIKHNKLRYLLLKTDFMNVNNRKFFIYLHFYSLMFTHVRIQSQFLLLPPCYDCIVEVELSDAIINEDATIF